jgi:peptide/nickel transport system substrate-binding protein
MSYAMNRRSFIAGGIALGAGLAVVGSDTDWASAAFTNGSGNGVSNAKPKHGGSIVVGVDAEEGGFDPTSARWDNVGFLYGRTVFDPLAIINSEGDVEPYLAESITPNADFTSFVITLRSGISFHDGSPLNSAALLLNLQKQQKSLLTGPAFSNIASSTITGPLSVTVAMKSPWAPFPYYLAAAQTGYIAAPSMLNSPTGTSNPIGTGPFIFSQWIPNNHFTATRNPHYWRTGLPYLNSITFKPIIEPTAMVEALQTGTIDMAVFATPASILELRGDKKFSYYDNSGTILGQPTVNCTMLNTGAPPFNNKTLRQAVAMASNAKQYSKVIDKGVNTPMNGLFLPGSPYYTSTAYPAHNPKGAAKLVKQIEKQTGQPVSFILSSTNDPTVIRSAEFLQQECETAGMKVSINVVAQSDLINNALAGTYQATTWSQFGAIDPDENYVWWSTTTIAKGLSLNMAENSDPRIQTELELGRTSSDKATRIKAYQKINQYLGEDIPYVWADRATWAVATKPNVQNFVNAKTLSGSQAYSFDEGVLWLTQIWVS